MEEKTFFQYEDVLVTNTRFVVDGQTFAMSNITSVKPREQKPNRVLPILLIAVGLLLSINGAIGAIIASLVGGVWLVLQKTTYHVMLHTSGGETSALKTHQKDYIEKVVAALNSAIVHRG